MIVVVVVEIVAVASVFVASSAGRQQRLSLPSPTSPTKLVRRPFDGYDDGRRPVGLLDDARVADRRTTVAAAADPKRPGRFGRQPPARRDDGRRAAGQFPGRRAPDERQRRAPPAGRRRAVGRRVFGLQQGQGGRRQGPSGGQLLLLPRRGLHGVHRVHQTGHCQYGPGGRLQRYVKRGSATPRAPSHRRHGGRCRRFGGHRLIALSSAAFGKPRRLSDDHHSDHI